MVFLDVDLLLDRYSTVPVQQMMVSEIGSKPVGNLKTLGTSRVQRQAEKEIARKRKRQSSGLIRLPTLEVTVATVIFLVVSLTPTLYVIRS